MMASGMEMLMRLLGMGGAGMAGGAPGGGMPDPNPRVTDSGWNKRLQSPEEIRTQMMQQMLSGPAGNPRPPAEFYGDMHGARTFAKGEPPSPNQPRPRRARRGGELSSGKPGPDPYHEGGPGRTKFNPKPASTREQLAEQVDNDTNELPKKKKKQTGASEKKKLDKKFERDKKKNR